MIQLAIENQIKSGLGQSFIQQQNELCGKTAAEYCFQIHKSFLLKP
jgi:hypothetical protein